jgi:hypothetical protein
VPQFYVLFHLTAQLTSSKSRLGIVIITLLFFGYHTIKLTQLQRDFVVENKMVESFRNEINLQTNSADDMLLFANPVEDFEKAGALMIYLNSKNAMNRVNTKLEIIDLVGYSELLPVYEEFKYKNSQTMNAEPLSKYKKWLVINDKVLSKIASNGFLKAPHTLIREGNYSIIVFD